MSNLIIDCGTYSVKFIEGRFTRKSFKVDEVHEVLLSDIRDENDFETPIVEHQQLIIRKFLQENDFTGKIITQLPNDFVTTRYLDLPVNNKKKATMMIPFQLDENLPFAITDSHYIASMDKNPAGTFNSIVQIAESDTFSSYHEYLMGGHTLPSVLLSELGVYQSYINDRKFGGHICIIDIGHETTKAYFAYNDSILSNHVSSIAGAKIDEVISKTYDITGDQARVYKHENAFFLTHNQVDQVSSDQKEFATLMHQCFTPLIHQIDRWILGHRIKTGFNVERIFITGGTSNINNIENYLTEQCKIPVEKLSILSLDNQVSKDEAPNLALAFLMGASQKFKELPGNFLIKQYASSLTNGVKLEDSVFSFYRIAIVCALFIIGLSVENFVFINGQITKYNKNIRKVLKDKDVGLTSKQQRFLKKRPKKLNSILKKKNRSLLADISVLEKATSESAMSSLAYLSKHIRVNEKISLMNFTNDLSKTTAKFVAESDRDLKQLKDLIKSLTLENLDIKQNDKAKEITISFTGY